MARMHKQFQLKSAGERGEFTARLARLWQVDKDGDVTLPGALDGQVVPVLIGHDWQQIPVGKAAVREEGGDVLVAGKLNLALPAGRQLYEALKFDLENPPAKAQWSYGFSVLESEPGVHEGQRVRFLKRVQIFEVSAVLAGAGDTATLAVKSNVEDDTLTGLSAQLERIASRIPTAPAENLPTALLLARQALWTAQGAVMYALAESEKASPFRYKYVRLPAEDPRWRAAVAALKDASYELGALEPYLRFFTEALPGERVDFVGDQPLMGAALAGSTIAVHADLGPADLRETIAHETFHVARPGASEEQADTFARNFSAEDNPAPRRLTSYLAKAAIFAELGRQRGWSGKELRDVLAQL